MIVIIAGKNNIAIDVVKYLVSQSKVYKIFAVFNSNDHGTDGFQRSYKKYCEKNNISSISLNDAYGIKDAIFISLEFDKIVKPELFSHDRIFNIHFSLLPKYKGMYTSAWPIINGEESSGVTFHRIDRGIDTGEILFQEMFYLESNETAKSLYEKYISTGTKLVLDNIDKIVQGDFVATPQNYVGSTYYSKKSINYNAVQIDFNQTAFQMKNQINAFTFRDFQLATINGESVCGVEILNDKSKISPRVISEDELCFIIATIDYNVCVFKDTHSKLISSVLNGDIGLVQRYANIYNVNEKNRNGWSPIIIAAYHGKLDIVKYLISIGAKINDTNVNGTSVFMYAKDFAIKNNNLEILQELVLLGADPKLKDFKGLDVFDYLKMSNECFADNIVNYFQ